jgi:glycerophosphoryl diester phosphodiesterase
MKHIVYGMATALLAFSCAGTKKATGNKSITMGFPAFDEEAHRGGRGLMPENTIPAMMNAIDLGVTTLEMDTHITQDNKVVVSHDPYFNENFTTTPEGKTLTKAEAVKRLLYTMTYDSIQKYDVGLKPYAAFPRQKKIAVQKPLLADLLDATEKHAGEKGKAMFYNIEIKSKPENDGKKHPPVEAFVDLVMQVILQKGTEARTVIQSFDPRALQVMHRKYPSVATSLLIEDYDKRSVEEQLQHLGFTPFVYSPHFLLVTPQLVQQCRSRQMKLVPWTINTLEQIQQLKNMGVDGIITDYPDLFQQLK